MKSLFLDNETMSILASIRRGEIKDEVEREMQLMKLEAALKAAGAFEMEDDVEVADDEEDEEDEVAEVSDRDASEQESSMDEMCQTMLETYLTSPTRLTLQYVGEKHIVQRGYYFVDDIIVMLDAYRDGGELMWLPTFQLLAGSLADMIADREIDCENEEVTGDFFEYCDEKNYKENMKSNVPEGKYRQVLEAVDAHTSYLWMKGVAADGDKCFVHVVFKDQCAFYYRQEEERFTYGTADLPTIVNILGNWMLYQHRELIMQMQSEEDEDVL